MVYADDLVIFLKLQLYTHCSRMLILITINCLKLRAHLPSILDTHPLETCNMRDISHGLAPECASSTIFCRVESGNGRPLTYTPPSWLIPLWPAAEQPNRAAELWTIAAAAAVMLQWSESSEKDNKNTILNVIIYTT